MFLLTNPCIEITNINDPLIFCFFLLDFYVGTFLGKLCVPNIFDVRARLIVDASHVFPQSVLAVIPFIRGMVDV